MNRNGCLRGVLAVAALGAPSALGAESLEVVHQPIACVVAGQYPELHARLLPEPGVARGRILFHGARGDAFYYVDMRRAEADYVGILPKPAATLRQFSYYIEGTGAALETGQTAEFDVRVVARASDCDSNLLVAAVSAVGPAVVGSPPGAAGLPAGFSVGRAPPTTAAGAASHSSGLSGGVVLGAVAVAGAVGGGVALASRDSASSAASSAPPPTPSPTPSPSVRPPQQLILALSNNCTLYGGTAVYAGDTVTVARGMCDWTTLPDAEKAVAGQTATLTVDGAPLGPVRYFTYMQNGLGCASAEADWRATAGQHVAAGIWTLPASPLHSCAVTVLP